MHVTLCHASLSRWKRQRVLRARYVISLPCLHLHVSHCIGCIEVCCLGCVQLVFTMAQIHCHNAAILSETVLLVTMIQCPVLLFQICPEMPNCLSAVVTA